MADIPPPLPPDRPAWMAEPSGIIQMPIARGSALTFGNAMATVSDTGAVTVDWTRVEEAAKAPDSPFSDQISKRIAQLLLAIRDKTYKTNN